MAAIFVIVFFGVFIYYNGRKDEIEHHRKKEDDYSKGIEGEDKVIDELQKLNDDYYLANDIMLNAIDGNIDHVIFGPNLIGVMETKNYSGTLSCEGDQWYRTYPNGGRIDIDSPSIQVKKNAANLRKYLESKGVSNRFIDAFVIFSNPDVQLEVSQSTVAVKKLEELNEYILNLEPLGRPLYNNELKAIEQVITHDFQ